MSAKPTDSQQQPEVKEAFNLKKRQKEIEDAYQKLEFARYELQTLEVFSRLDEKEWNILETLRIKLKYLFEAPCIGGPYDFVSSYTRMCTITTGGAPLESRLITIHKEIIERAEKLKSLLYDDEGEKILLIVDEGDFERVKRLVAEAQRDLFRTKAQYKLDILDNLDQVLIEGLLYAEVLFCDCADLIEAMSEVAYLDSGIDVPGIEKLRAKFRSESEKGKGLSTDEKQEILRELMGSEFDFETKEAQITEFGKMIDAKKTERDGGEVVGVSFQRKGEKYLSRMKGVSAEMAHVYVINISGDLKDLNQSEIIFMLEKLQRCRDEEMERLVEDYIDGGIEINYSDSKTAGALLAKKAADVLDVLGESDKPSDISAAFDEMKKLVEKVIEAANEEIGDKI